MRRALAHLPSAASCLLLAACLATPPAAPPVVSSSERRPLYQGALHSALMLAPPVEAQRSDAGALYTEFDTAVRRHLRGAGVPTTAAAPQPAGDAWPGWRRGGASHLVRIHVPAAAAGRTAVQLELRDSLTRTVVWRYAGELDATAGSPREQADRLAEAVVQRLREDGLLAR